MRLYNQFLNMGSWPSKGQWKWWGGGREKILGNKKTLAKRMLKEKPRENKIKELISDKKQRITKKGDKLPPSHA